MATHPSSSEDEGMATRMAASTGYDGDGNTPVVDGGVDLDAFINSDVGADQIVTSPPRGIFLLFRYSDGLFRPSE